MYSTISRPEKYAFPKDLYIIDSREVRGSGPQWRDKAKCKTALTKAFNYFKRYQRVNSGLTEEKVRYVTTHFGVTKIYNYAGDLIFDRNSPIMIEFAQGNVTKEQVVKAIPW